MARSDGGNIDNAQHMVLCSITRREITAVLQSDETCGTIKKTLRGDILLPLLRTKKNTYL